MWLRGYRPSMMSTAELSILSDYIWTGVPASVVLWVGTDLAPRVLAPYWDLAEGLSPPWQWTAALITLFVVSMIGGRWVDRLLARKAGGRP